jgi:hypothetical protein
MHTIMNCSHAALLLLRPSQHVGAASNVFEDAKNSCMCFSWWSSFNGTQEWEFFWLRFWILYYFIVSYAQILRFWKKIFDQAIMGGDTIILLSLRLAESSFLCRYLESKQFILMVRQTQLSTCPQISLNSTLL